MSERQNITDELPAEHRAKFQPDGAPRPFYGVTVISHLRNDQSNHQVFAQAIADHLPDLTTIKASDLPGKVAFVKLPIPSYHMTIFDTKVYHEWRMDIPAGTSPESLLKLEMNRDFQPRFAAIKHQFYKYLPVTVNIDLDASRRAERGHTLIIPLIPADQTSKLRLQQMRHLLCTSFDMPRPENMNSFEFHLTVYYPINALNEKDFEAVENKWQEGVEEIAASVGGLVIGSVELCEFANMCHFEVVDAVGGKCS